MSVDDEKWMKESLEPDLPEAKASITVRGYYKGFSVLITKRNAEGEVELDNVMAAIDNMVAKGFKPSWAEETNGKHTPPIPLKTKPCETCGGTRTFKEGVSKAGKKWAGWFCENSQCAPEWASTSKI